MKRRTLLGSAAAAAVAALARPAIAAPVTVRWWYHLDNPNNSPDELIARFEKQNPDIKIHGENIPWGGGSDYYNRLFASIIAGRAPDAAMVKLLAQPQLAEMRAIEPIDRFLKDWPARTKIADSIWNINKGMNGSQYYLPLHYVILFLYYRADRFDEIKMVPPKSFDDFLEAAKRLTRNGEYGFGMRSGVGGWDNWGPFVLGAGANFDKGGMVTPGALAANRWYLDLALKHKVVPPSAAGDGFRQIIDAFKAGRTSMIINHVTTTQELTEALGDRISAVPVPRDGVHKPWTSFGDESSAIFSASKIKEAAFRWISFLSAPENNTDWCKVAGQFPVALDPARASQPMHPQRFVDATVQSLPFAGVLPPSAKTSDFTRTVWQANIQQALLGQISPDDMMRAYDKHYNG